MHDLDRYSDVNVLTQDTPADSECKLLTLYNVYPGQGCDPNVKRERLMDKMDYLTEHT